MYCTIALPDRLLSMQWPGLRWDTVQLAEIHCYHLRCTADDCHMGLHLNIYTMTLLYTTLLIHVSSFACYSFSEASSGFKLLCIYECLIVIICPFQSPSFLTITAVGTRGVGRISDLQLN